MSVGSLVMDQQFEEYPSQLKWTMSVKLPDNLPSAVSYIVCKIEFSFYTRLRSLWPDLRNTHISSIIYLLFEYILFIAEADLEIFD